MKGQPPRIEHSPTREPVNRQAALIMRRANWINQPPIAETVSAERYEAMKIENEQQKLKIWAQKNEINVLNKKLVKIKREHQESKKHLEEVIAEARKKAEIMVGDEKIMLTKRLNKIEAILKLEGIGPDPKPA